MLIIGQTAYKVRYNKSGTLKPLKSPANTPNPTGRGLLGFTRA